MDGRNTLPNESTEKTMDLPNAQKELSAESTKPAAERTAIEAILEDQMFVPVPDDEPEIEAHSEKDEPQRRAVEPTIAPPNTPVNQVAPVAAVVETPAVEMKPEPTRMAAEPTTVSPAASVAAVVEAPAVEVKHEPTRLAAEPTNVAPAAPAIEAAVAVVASSDKPAEERGEANSASGPAAEVLTKADGENKKHHHKHHHRDKGKKEETRQAAIEEKKEEHKEEAISEVKEEPQKTEAVSQPAKKIGFGQKVKNELKKAKSNLHGLFHPHHKEHAERHKAEADHTHDAHHHWVHRHKKTK